MVGEFQTDNGKQGGLTASNSREFTVSEISSAIKRTIEGAFGRVRVRGEVTGFKRAASGHLYMSLKDDSTVLDAVCWRGTASRLTYIPEEGLEMIFVGQITSYPGRSKYQLVIEEVELAGEGALMALLEKRRKELAAEGLFDDASKRELPFLPEVIGVVTSPTGAVIRDILHRLADRFPRHVIIWPAAVQGVEAAEQISGAINGFNLLERDSPVPRPDLLIVARGGGSLEDLWAFNEEIVVRSTAASEIPIISAVGHETDTTLIDLAADLRAPTPSAAAEMAVPVRSELHLVVSGLDRRAEGAVTRCIEEARTNLRAANRGLRSPRDYLEYSIQRLDDLTEDLHKALINGVDSRMSELIEAAARLHPSHVVREIRGENNRTDELARRLKSAIGHYLSDVSLALRSQDKILESLSFQRVLERGYTVVRDKDANPITSIDKIGSGMKLGITFQDGTVHANVENGKARMTRTTIQRKPGSQGRLL